MIKGAAGIAIFPMRDGSGNFVQGSRIETKHFTDLARSHATAVGNHVGGHGGAAFTITAIQILNYALAIVAAGKVEIDVGPLATLFGKKALKEQLHANG